MKLFYVFVIVLSILFDGGEFSCIRRSHLDPLELALEVYESYKVPLERSVVDSIPLNTKQNYLRDLISQARTELRQLSAISDRSSADRVRNRGNFISRKAQMWRDIYNDFVDTNPRRGLYEYNPHRFAGSSYARQPSRNYPYNVEVSPYYRAVKDRIEARINDKRDRGGFRKMRVTFYDEYEYALTKMSQRGRKDDVSGIMFNLAVDIRLDGRLNRCEFTVNHKPRKGYRNMMKNVLLGLMCRDVEDRNSHLSAVNYPHLPEEMRDM